jgi:hypothetical protein
MRVYMLLSTGLLATGGCTPSRAACCPCAPIATPAIADPGDDAKAIAFETLRNAFAQQIRARTAPSAAALSAVDAATEAEGMLEGMRKGARVRAANILASNLLRASRESDSAKAALERDRATENYKVELVRLERTYADAKRIVAESGNSGLTPPSK